MAADSARGDDGAHTVRVGGLVTWSRGRLVIGITDRINSLRTARRSHRREFALHNQTSRLKLLYFTSRSRTVVLNLWGIPQWCGMAELPSGELRFF